MRENKKDHKIFALSIREGEENEWDFDFVNRNIPTEVIISHLRAFLKEQEDDYLKKFKLRYD